HPSERKFRLFCCACCRRVWSLMVDERSRQAVMIAERYADDKATEAELTRAGEAAGFADEPDDLIRFSVSGVVAGPGRMHFATARTIAEECATVVLGRSGQSECRRAEERVQSDLLREVFGNPFRPAILKPAWRTPDVRALADCIHAERAFDQLPILA